MKIRKAVKNDLHGILDLYQLLFSEMAALDNERIQSAEQQPEFIEEAINNVKFHLIVADVEGQIKGFCIAQKQSAAPFNCMVARDFAYVFDLVVEPNFRGEKVGHNLLNEMKEWAKCNQLSHLELSVLSQNRRAIKFYEREGLTEITRTMGIKI
ncbi:GNAT family N-acetyltransferase [Providencia heimbachae]|uniref:Acetyltransferase n=1 Tax=Providencia heimbachae ATCC 35613 TaxID=1354272 RepID=A0A1B7JZR9_9GAMM|nr:GNAT family N-acetyltransferase [Providencia heimbachae]OAT53386.1 acetyltransferase [Providencia heimbachae ATCC 35613]SQH14123.1 ribosomal-protein-alanine N-acetyltransferase [Providencia heimbachae]